jgi:hypothetical protein
MTQLSFCHRQKPLCPVCPPANEGPDLKQSSLIRNNGSILLSKIPPTVNAVSLPELKRRVLDMRAKKAKADKQQVRFRPVKHSDSPLQV